MDRSAIISQLRQYSSSFSEELFFVDQFITLLNHPRCFFRDHLPGHMTGSAFITTRDYTKVLLVKHAKLNKWLQPGGHADGIENIQLVAHKEATEETGVSKLQVKGETFFDIDIHVIPVSSNFPEHLHYDIRYLFIADENESLIINHESHDLQWVELANLGNYTQEKSILRMKKKLLNATAK